MNLICFPTYCAGAILCDLLNYEKSNESKGGIDNLNSSKLKVPFNKNNTILWYNIFFEKKIKNLDLNQNIWLGTHCWPSEVDTTRFEKVLLVYTNSKMSRVYRLMRAYFLFDNLHKKYNFDNDKLKDIDEKLQKLNLTEFKFDYASVDDSNIVTLDFEDIVQWTNDFHDFTKQNSLNYSLDHFIERKNYWKTTNYFLYEQSIVDKFIKRYDDYEKMLGI